MARVKNVSGEALKVPELGGAVVEPDEIVEVPDDRYEGYVPLSEHRSESPVWEGIEAPTDDGTLRGSALKGALLEAGLSTAGHPDALRKALAEHQAEHKKPAKKSAAKVKDN